MRRILACLIASLFMTSAAQAAPRPLMALGEREDVALAGWDESQIFAGTPTGGWGAVAPMGDARHLPVADDAYPEDGRIIANERFEDDAFQLVTYDPARAAWWTACCAPTAGSCSPRPGGAIYAVPPGAESDRELVKDGSDQRDRLVFARDSGLRVREPSGRIRAFGIPTVGPARVCGASSTSPAGTSSAAASGSSALRGPPRAARGPCS